jgi:hypothetical protein
MGMLRQADHHVVKDSNVDNVCAQNKPCTPIFGRHFSKKKGPHGIGDNVIFIFCMVSMYEQRIILPLLHI